MSREKIVRWAKILLPVMLIFYVFWNDMLITSLLYDKTYIANFFIFFSNKKSLQSTDDQGRTPLHIASINGNPRLVKFLIKKGADLDARTFIRYMKCGFKTPLHLAVESKNPEVVKLLISAGANINAEDNCSETPLTVCSSITDVPDVERLLIENGAYNENDSLTNIIDLYNPQYNKKRDIGIYEPGEFFSNGFTTPLHHLVRGWGGSGKYSKDTEELILRLCDNRMMLNSRDNDGITPLGRAVITGNEEAIKLLLQKKPLLNTRDLIGRTPMHYAVDFGNRVNIELLLNSGADPNIRDNSGKTPLSFTKNKSRLWYQRDQLDGIIKLLKKHGATE